jgi:hypothetical protein
MVSLKPVAHPVTHYSIVAVECRLPKRITIEIHPYFSDDNTFGAKWETPSVILYQPIRNQ